LTEPLPEDGTQASAAAPANEATGGAGVQPDPPATSAPAEGSGSPVHRPRRSNYFARHWRGELSLGVTYWINGALAGFLVFIAGEILAASFSAFRINYSAPLLWCAFWVLCCAVTLWQAVGIWRSAKRHIETTQRTFWGRAAQVVAILALFRLVSDLSTRGLPIIQKSLNQAQWLEEGGKWDFRVLKDGTELEISGGIGFGMADDLERLLAATPRMSLVHVNLGVGGLDSEARRVRNLIRWRRLSTYTSSSCVSACTIIFLGGVQRYLRAGAQLGFHAPEVAGLVGPRLRTMLEEEERYLTSIGVSPAFAARIVQTPPEELWFPTERELLEGGIVTEITRGEDFSLSGIGKSANIASFDLVLQKLRLYRAMKTVDPETYDKLLRASFDGYKNGKSAAELREVIFDLIAPVFASKLPYSSDAAILHFTRVMVAQLTMLQNAPGRICLDYIHARGGAVITAAKYLSSQISDEEIEAMADVLESADPTRPLPRKQTLDLMIKRGLRQAQKRIGNDVFAIARLDDPNLDPALGCRAATAFYSALLSLPANDAAIALRGAFAGK